MDEYKRKVDSIQAPEALIAATLNRIHEEESKAPRADSQQSAAVIPFKPRRKWIRTAAFAAAAALALVIGLNMKTSKTELTYGTIPDTIIRSNLPVSNTQQIEPAEYSDLVNMDITSLLPGGVIIKSDIQVILENDFILTDECTLTYNADGKPLILRLSRTQDILPDSLTQVEPSDVDGLRVYAAVSASGKIRIAGFRHADFSFLLMGTDIEQEPFESLLNNLIQNIQ